MEFAIEVETEADGRWIAEIPAISGAMVYGATREQAMSKVKALALRIIADQLEHGETSADLNTVSFLAA